MLIVATPKFKKLQNSLNRHYSVQTCFRNSSLWQVTQRNILVKIISNLKFKC